MCLHRCLRHSKSGQVHCGLTGSGFTIYMPPCCPTLPDCDGTNHLTPSSERCSFAFAAITNPRCSLSCCSSIVSLPFVRRLAHNGFAEGRCEQSRLVFNEARTVSAVLGLCYFFPRFFVLLA